DLKDGQSVYAYKVVVCAGAGGHRVPQQLQGAKERFPRHVIDIDEFARLRPSDLSPQTRVVVVGSNAAIDAVHKALNYNGKIYWLIELGEGEVPPMLDTQPRMLEAWKNQDKAKLTVIRFSSYQFVDQFSGGLLQLRVKPLGGGPDSFAMGNYIVYG